MEKFAYRNKFRVLDPNGHTLYLNTIVNVKGTSQFVEGFETLKEAQAARDIHAYISGISPELFKVECYPEQYLLTIPVSSDKDINKELSKRKIFSGKALELNTSLRRTEENKYRAGKYYTREVWFAQSIEHSKGRTTLPKEKRKKNEGLNDTATFEKINRLNGSSFLLDNIVDNLRKKNFPNRKALKDYLQPKGFSHRRIEKIFHLLTM